jgi:hypothetical protein
MENALAIGGFVLSLVSTVFTTLGFFLARRTVSAPAQPLPPAGALPGDARTVLPSSPPVSARSAGLVRPLLFVLSLIVLIVTAVYLFF